jgi:HEAT repeat protein
VLAFNNGVPSQIGVTLSGILLIVADQVLTVQQIFLMGTVLAIVCGILIWQMRKAYALALVDALRMGRMEVFSSEATAFQGLRGDAAALEVAIRALQEPKASTRRIAAEMLGRMESDSAIPHLTRLLSDPEPVVRASAVSSLERLLADSAVGAIILLLDDPDEQVREEALRALSKLKVTASPDLTRKIFGLITNDPSLAVQTKAIVALIKLGAVDQARSKLVPRLESEDPQIRLSALELMDKIGPLLNGSRSAQPILRALADPSAPIRRAAVSALASFSDAQMERKLIPCLSDADEGVRSAAAKGLRRRSRESRAFVLELFEKDDAVIDSALDALAPGETETLAPLRTYPQRELTHAYTATPGRQSSALWSGSEHAARPPQQAGIPV